MPWDAILKYSAGLISGIVLSIVTPWIRWVFLKRELRRESRVKAINACRKLANQYGFSFRLFRETPEYSQLRHMFSDRLIKAINSDAIRVSITDTTPTIADRKMVLKELSKIERKWGLL